MENLQITRAPLVYILIFAVNQMAICHLKGDTGNQKE